jgi:hypothetical protein
MTKSSRQSRSLTWWVTWTAILAPVPYSLSRLVWALGVPFGIDEQLLRDFKSPGIGSLYILCLALLPEVTALYTHAFLVVRRRFVPARVPFAGGRPVRPSLVVVPLLAPIAILTGFNVWSLGPIMDGFAIPEANAGLPGWSFWGQVASFWVWGVSLAVATAAYWWSARGGRRAAADGRGSAVAA